MSRELLQQALHHLVALADDLRRIPSDIAQTIAAIEAELAKPEQGPFKPDWVSYRQGLADGAAQPEHANPAAQHWHDLYYAKCKDFQDQQARLGAEIAALEEELAELKEEQPKQQFYPDWDMLKPYHERIAELEAQLAKPDMPTKIFGPNLEQILNAAGFYKPEQGTYVYAKRLAEFIWEKHFQKESPDWKPLKNTFGVLTQIDNMTYVLEKAKPEQEPRKPWVGLTNDEINDFSAGCHLGKSVQSAIYQAAAKLKERNT